MMLTLYVGTRKEGAKQRIQTLVREQFESFTVIAGEGYYQGRSEPLWEVKIATCAPLAVLELAGRIRQELDQESVGLEHAGHYYRFTGSHSAHDLRHQFEAWSPDR